jgi:hypothetical protein
MTNKELLTKILLSEKFAINIQYLEISKIQFICLFFQDYLNTKDNGLQNQVNFKDISFLIPEDNYLKQAGLSEISNYKIISHNTFIKLLKLTDEKYTIKDFLNDR